MNQQINIFSLSTLKVIVLGTKKHIFSLLAMTECLHLYLEAVSFPSVLFSSQRDVCAGGSFSLALFWWQLHLAVALIMAMTGTPSPVTMATHTSAFLLIMPIVFLSFNIPLISFPFLFPVFLFSPLFFSVFLFFSSYHFFPPSELAWAHTNVLPVFTGLQQVLD